MRSTIRLGGLNSHCRRPFQSQTTGNSAPCSPSLTLTEALMGTLQLLFSKCISPDTAPKKYYNTLLFTDARYKSSASKWSLNLCISFCYFHVWNSSGSWLDHLILVSHQKYTPSFVYICSKRFEKCWWDKLTEEIDFMEQEVQHMKHV